jgi:hypothetical protein
VAKNPAAHPPLPAAEQRQLHGQYRDRCGRRFTIASRPPHGFGLYAHDAPPGAQPHQNDARELARLISFDSFTRL